MGATLRHQLPVLSPLSAGALSMGLWRALPGGDPRSELRSHLLARFDARAAWLSGSGTQALQLALGHAIRGAEGLAVALPAYACYDVASAAIGAGALVSLYDLDPETLTPDLESLERVLRSGARVVVVAPLYGIPADWHELTDLAARYDAILIEDAAQGHGASWRGRPLGGLGPISVLSFGRGKGWTGGRGGVTLFRSSPGEHHSPAPGFADELQVLMTVAAQLLLGRPSIYGIPSRLPWLGLGETRFHPPGDIEGISRLSAALLLAGREAAEREAEARRSNAEALLSALDEVASVRRIRVAPGAAPGYLRLPVRLTGRGSEIRDIEPLRTLGVARGYPSTLRLAELRPRLVPVDQRFPGADQLVRELVTVPTHSRVGLRDRASIVRLLRVAPAYRPPSPAYQT